MAILAADKQRLNRGVDPRNNLSLPLLGYTNNGNAVNTVFKGSMVVGRNANGKYFQAVPLTSGTNMVATDVFGGVADEYMQVNSTMLADGLKRVNVIRDGLVAFAKGAIVQGDMGKPAYASDDDTITTTSANNLWVGNIADLDSTYVWVDISNAVGKVNVAN